LGDGAERTFGVRAAPWRRPRCSGQRLLIEGLYDAPLELDEPELEPMLGQFPLFGALLGAWLGAVVLGVVVLGVVVVELPLAAQAAPPALSAAAATIGAM
jgi:hypothetical protein